MGPLPASLVTLTCVPHHQPIPSKNPPCTIGELKFCPKGCRKQGPYSQCATLLNKYPKAPVTAPLANLPPPATLPRPPRIADAAVPPSRWPISVLALGNALPIRGAPAALTPAARAPGPHLPPDATADRQPTAACPAMLSSPLGAR